MKKKSIISRSEMVAITNSVTNEMETAKVTMIVQRDQPKYKGEPFTMMFQAVNSVIARQITPATAKLLLYLVSEVQYGNLVPKGIPQMAEELGYSQRQVHRAMKELEDLKIILKSKHPQDARSTMYHINPVQSWKGTVRDRGKKISAYDKNQLDIFGKLPSKKKPDAIQPNEDFVKSPMIE